jgi:DNA/RNA endonuclease YhcR with UshA esterase domain
MRTPLSAILLSATLLLPATASPHHSFSLEFDVNRPVELTGTVSSIEWTNPHAWIFLEVEDENGNVQNWSAEFLGVLTLMRRGMSPQTLGPGDRVTITGYGSRDGSNTANASTLTLTETGQVLWSAER